MYNKGKTTLILYPAQKSNTSYSVLNGATVIGNNAFYNAENLQKIEIPSTVTTIGEFAFDGMSNLEEVNLYWNIRADNLWDFSKNTALKSILITDAKKMTFNPDKVKTSSVLEDVWFAGGMFDNYPVESLDAFTGMPALKRLRLHNIRLNRKNLEALSAMPALERFDFDAGMLTTEEIAWIVAKYPHLSGDSLCAYNTEDAVMNDVRVCGFRKPGLDLPQHRKRLDSKRRL